MSRPLVDPSPVTSILRAATLSLLPACLLWISMPIALAQQGVQVRAQNGLLSVQANNASANELAEVLSDQLGISVVVTGDTETLINIDIIDEPLDKALAKLSPNHMLVRNSKQPDSAITEVVLMMGEGNGSVSSGGGDDQFLPSGSPADDVIISDDQPLVDEAADAPVNDATDQSPENFGDSPPPESFDPITGLPIDPVTGLPLE